MKTINKAIYILALLFLSNAASAQFGYGLTVSNDLYHRYSNPSDDISSRSAGSAILNLGIGPKIWVGGQSMSLSVEAQAVFGIFGLSVRDYKGLGTFAFPVMAKLNFNGLSGLDKEGKMGWHIGGGIQYNRTEFYGLSSSAQEDGIMRPTYKTYVGQVGYGFGINGFGVAFFGRYGWNPDNDANALSIGFQWDFNARQMKNIRQKASEL